MIDELEALSAEYETATPERSWEIYNRLLEIGAGMGSDGYWRMRDAAWRTPTSIPQRRLDEVQV